MASAPPPPDVLTATFGPFVTGIMMQMLLMGIIVVQGWHYYGVFDNDPKSYKIFVGVLLVVTTLQCVMDYMILYRCTVTFYGNFDKFDDTDWTLWWEIAVTAIIGSLSQGFFLHRCWSATKSRLAVIIGCFGIATSLSSGIASTIKFQQIQRLSKVPEIDGPILTWLISTASVDIGITAVLIWTISRKKTRFKKTETLISKLVRLSFTTSAVTATLAMINVILYMALPGKAWHLLPQLIMGKVYVISCMVTLASRIELRELLEATENSSYVSTRTGSKVTVKRRSGTVTSVGTPTSRSKADHNLHQKTSGGPIQVRTTTTTVTRGDDRELELDLDLENGREMESDTDLDGMEMKRVKGRQGDLETSVPVEFPVDVGGDGEDSVRSEMVKPTFTRLGVGV